MTYPPPPGVPGDPGQQPMPDPYAPGGGFAPPPQDPYGTPPPSMDPYGAPPPQDPYGQPPQDPYGSPPMSGVPMSPGAPGMATDPYGQPPMGGMPGQQPSFLGGQPPKQSSNLGMILGIGGGALVVIILAVVVIVMVSSGNSDDSAGGGDDKTSGAASDDPSASGDGGDSGGSGTYAVTQGMCEKVDVSGVPSSLGLSKLDDLTLDDEMYCSSMGDTLVSIKGKAYGDATEAEAGYEEYKDSETVGGDGLQEFSGDWDKGEISQYANLEGTASVFIQDGNMVITMYISNTDSVTNAEAKDGAAALAAGVFAAAGG